MEAPMPSINLVVSFVIGGILGWPSAHADIIHRRSFCLLNCRKSPEIKAGALVKAILNWLWLRTNNGFVRDRNLGEEPPG
jgi:hypothetical protein